MSIACSLERKQLVSKRSLPMNCHSAKHIRVRLCQNPGYQSITRVFSSVYLTIENHELVILSSYVNVLDANQDVR